MSFVGGVTYFGAKADATCFSVTTHAVSNFTFSTKNLEPGSKSTSLPFENSLLGSTRPSLPLIINSTPIALS